MHNFQKDKAENEDRFIVIVNEIYSDLSINEVQSLFEEWGGILDIFWNVLI